MKQQDQVKLGKMEASGPELTIHSADYRADLRVLHLQSESTIKPWIAEQATAGRSCSGKSVTLLGSVALCSQNHLKFAFLFDAAALNTGIEIYAGAQLSVGDLFILTWCVFEEARSCSLSVGASTKWNEHQSLTFGLKALHRLLGDCQ